MRDQLSPPFSRALALVLLLALVWGLYALMVKPALMAHARYAADIEQARDMLDRYRRIAGELPTAETALAAAQRAHASEAGFLAAPNDTLAAADLQNRIKTLIENAGGALRSTQAMAVRDEEKAQRITARVQFGATIDALQKILYGIESSTPFLFVDNFDVQQRGAAGAEHDGPVRLDIGLDVYGYLRARTP